MNLDRMRNVSGNFVRARSFVRELLLVCKRGIMFVENDEYIFNDGFLSFLFLCLGTVYC